MKSISVCLWFDHQAEEAAEYYKTVFSNFTIGQIARYSEAGAEVSGQKKGSVMTVGFQMENLEVLGLNGGPQFKFSPALSFFVSCENEAEIDEKWKKLSKGGTVRFGFDKYPWAEKYGWTADRFGVEWQLMLAPRPQKIAPSFLFVDSLFGKGEEAIHFYTGLFPNSRIDNLVRDEELKTIMHCAFQLNGQNFTLMEGKGKHGHAFNEATSLVVYCENQDEIDRYWNKLSEGGSESQCGWLKDKYGVSWQIVPTILADLMADPARAEKTMNSMLKMSKLDIATLIAAQ